MATLAEVLSSLVSHAFEAGLSGIPGKDGRLEAGKRHRGNDWFAIEEGIRPTSIGNDAYLAGK